MTILCAATEDVPKSEQNIYSGGAVMGFGFSPGNKALMQVGYYGPCWLVDVGASGQFEKGFHNVFLASHLGLRHRLYQNLFIPYGFVGSGNFMGISKQWSAGVFTGFDYQLSQHFLLTAKVYPYSYDNRIWRTHNNIFVNAMVSLFYVF